MEAGREELQVVQVISNCRLVDAQSCERMYWRRNGLGVAAGWYVVTLPPGAVPGRFSEEALFRGPFLQREEAEVVMRQVTSRVRVREALAASASNPASVALAQSRIEASQAPSADDVSRPKPGHRA